MEEGKADKNGGIPGRPASQQPANQEECHRNGQRSENDVGKLEEEVRLSEHEREMRENMMQRRGAVRGNGRRPLIFQAGKELIERQQRTSGCDDFVPPDIVTGKIEQAENKTADRQ